MNRDEREGLAKEWKGRAKQAVGDLTDDERRRDEGEKLEQDGKVQAGLGKVRRKIGEALEDLGKDVKS